MTRNIDELNNLNTRAEEPEEYFKKMVLPEEEKERRVEYTKKANEIFDLILVLALLSDDKSPSFFASLRDRLETYLITLINEFTVPDDYLIDYASDTAFNFVDTTEKHIDDPWYTSEDRALFNAENGANDVLNYDLYMQAIADGKTHKKWITEKDNRVRKTHRPLDGKTIGIKELFYVGGIPMRFPKDYEYAEAFPQELINCRCSIEYLPKSTDEFHCYGDYLRDVMGSAKDNNPEELQEIIAQVESMGGEVRLMPNYTSMTTDIRKGEPGIIKVDENASIGAIRHEYRHFLDDMANGNPGLRYYLEDNDKFFEYEKRGYEEELAIARKYGYNEIEEKILKEIERRKREIYGTNYIS